MDTDQIKGKLQNAFGKTEEAVGKAVNSPDLQNAGTEDRLKGAAKETWGNAKDTAREVRDTARTNVAAHGEDASLRDKVVNGVENIRDNVNAKLDQHKADEQFKRDELRRTA